MYSTEMFKPRFHANKDCRKMNCLSRMIGSRGTQTKFVFHIVESLCAKFGAFFQSVTIFSLNHLTKGDGKRDKVFHLKTASKKNLLQHIFGRKKLSLEQG